MSFTRYELRSIGVEESKVEEIMSLHGKDVQDLQSKEEQARNNHDAAKKEIQLYKDRVDEQNTKLDELRNQVNSGEDLNKQVEALKEANRQKDDEHQEEMNKVKLSYEIDKELDRAGAKNSIAVMALVDRDDVKLTDEGLLGLSEQLESLKESDSYLFNDTNTTDNSNTDDKDGGDNDNGEQGETNTNDQANTGINYNAGQGKGNNGNTVAEGTLGRKAAERLLK